MVRAMVVNKLGGGFSLSNVDLALPVGREVLIDVKASGLCHSDHSAMRFDIGFPAPSVLGHELAGVVASVGPDVTEFDVGDHVVGSVLRYCGRCVNCITGEVGLCLNPDTTLRAPEEPPRITRDGDAVAQGMGLGGFAERALVHENQLVRIPEQVPWPQAALLGCGVITGAGAVLNTADVLAGDTVAVIGAGGVGLNAISAAVVAGAASIIAIDIADVTLERAKRFGATHVINSTAVDAVAALRDIVPGGVRHAFDLVGIPEATQSGWDMIAKGGVLYLVGMGSPESALSINNLEAMRMRKSVHGVYYGSANPKRDIPMIAGLYLQGRFNLDDLVSREIALDEVNEGYEMLARPDVTRVVITRF